MTYIDSNRVKKYSLSSQLAAPTLGDSKSDTPAWPWIRDDQPPSSFAQLALMGAHTIWLDRENVLDTEAVDAF